jgi:DNA invertase Pin-like site-specific DNA recombinase
MPQVKRCAIYTRKSTTAGLEQAFNSLDAQYEACLAYIQRQLGWSLIEERYDDGGFTGANIERPAFTRLLADVDARKVDIIVVYKVDRLSRSLLDFVKVLERLNTAGASFVAVTQNFSTADAMGRLTMNMLMSFAEFERSMIAERTRDKIAASRRKGMWTGGPVPFGYTKEEKKLVVNEVEAHTVREAFSLILVHRQVATVARLLTKQGLLPREPKRPSKLGQRWSKDAVGRMLRSPLYAGYMVLGDEVHQGQHPALVAESTFREVEALLDGAGRKQLHTGTNPDYLLRGLLRCGHCGQPMCPGSTKKGPKCWRYYRCTTRDKLGPTACPTKALPAKAIEDFVVQRISKATEDGTLAAAVADSLDRRIAAKRQAVEAMLKQLPSRVASASAAVSKLTEELSRLEGRAREMAEEKLVAESDKLVTSERLLAQAELDRKQLARAADEAQWMAGALRDFGRVWKWMTPENRLRLMRALVAQVRVAEATGEVEVELINFAIEAGAQEAA